MGQEDIGQEDMGQEVKPAPVFAPLCLVTVASENIADTEAAGATVTQMVKTVLELADYGQNSTVIIR